MTTVVLVISVVVVVVVVVVIAVVEAVVITAAVVLLIVMVKVVLVVMRAELLGVTLVVVVRDLLCAGAVIDTFVEVVTGDMRVTVLMIVSNVAVGLLMDSLTSITRGVLTKIDDDVVYVDANVFAGIMTALEFGMSGPLEEVR